MDNDIEKKIQERFAALPESVKEAIDDASVEQKLRALASTYKLHLDQWVLLENEIMLTLLGIEDPEDMARNISKEVGIDDSTAKKLVADIALQIFKPIREQMQITLDSKAIQRTTRPVLSSMEDKKTPSDTTAYKSGEKSSERREVQEDPYRESIE